MKKKSEIESRLGKLSDADTEIVNTSVEILNNLTEKDTYISTENLRRLEDVVRSLTSLKENHTWRLINLLKQGCEED